MSRRILLVLTIFVLGIASLMAQEASDSCLILMSPPTEYGVKIDTPTGGLNLGNVQLDTVYFSSSTVGISTVTNSGSVVSDWKIRGVALDTWQLYWGGGLDGVQKDSATIAAILTSTTTNGGTFGSNDMVMTSAGSMTGNSYSSDGSGVDGNDVPAGGQRRIHFRIHTPNQTTVTTQQRFRIIIEAYSADTFN
ncbi:MAG: hypothetical protein DRI22_01485 [Caldiserica bacterium]|nr:MAG: hypothetical protein DRI22_01485 [Caldisericota bacterium]